MKKLALIYLLMLVPWLNAGAQITTWAWAKRAGGNSDQEGKSVAIDASGNVYVTGYLSGTSNDFSNTILSVVGGHDIFIAKYDSSGNLLWVKSAGSSSFDEGLGIAVDGAGNPFVCGHFESSITFNGPSPVTLSSAGGRDIFLAKFDTNGDVQWAKKAGSTSDDAATSICTDGSYIFVTGYFRSSCNFGPGSLTSSGGRDIFIACYGAVTGTFNWALKGGSSGDDAGQGITMDANYIYATGLFENTCTFANLTGSLTSSGGQDAFVVKYDYNGYGVWKRSAGGSNNDAGQSIALNYPGLYVSGFFKGNASFYNSSSVAATLNAAANNDAFLAKYDAGTGNLAWARSENGTDDEYGYGVSIDQAGNIWTTGDFKGTLPLGTGPSITASDHDVYVTCYDPAGNVLGGMRAGGGNLDIGAGIAASNGKGYVTGYLKSVPAMFGNDALSSAGNEDIFIAKFGCLASAGIATASASSVCSGGAVTITLSNYSGNIQWQSSPASAGNWSNIPGATSASLNATPTANTDYRACVTQYPCDASFSTIASVTMIASPQLTITSGNTTVCAGDSAVLAVTGASAYTWSPSQGLSNTSSSSVNAAPASTTTYTITGVSSSGCPASTTITVNVNALPNVNASPSTSTICSGDQTSLSASGAFSYTWQPAAGLNATTGSSVSASPPASTTYTITGTSSNGCISTATATVNVNNPIGSNIVSGNQDICNGAQPAQLSGSSPLGGNGIYLYLWEESSDGLVWVPALGTNLLQDYLPGVLTADTWYRRTVLSGTCTGTSAPVMINVHPVPSASLAGSDTICEGDNASLSLQLTGVSPWSVSYSDGNQSYTVNGIASSPYTLNVAPSATSAYALVSVNDNIGCTGTSSGNADVTVNQKPAAAAGSDEEVCGLEAVLEAGASAFNGMWTSSPGVVFTDPVDPHTTVTLPAYGAYTFTWTETNGICSDQDDVSITAYEPLQSTDAGPDQDIYFTDQAVLNAAPPSPGSGTWSIISGTGSVSDPSSPNSIITGITGTDIVLQWTVTNGACGSVSDDVVLHVHNVIIPTGFSPNSDNTNDVFFIQGIENFSSSLTVFDRWGNEVYKASPYMNTWNGTNMKGEELGDDTYFYVLNVGDKSFTNYVVIKRK